MHAQGVDAICIISPRVSSLPMVSRSLRVPSVIIQTEPIPGSHCVAVDQLAGARAAVEHLQGLGHERILHLAGPDDWFESRLRREVWAQAVGGRLAAELAAEGDWGPTAATRSVDPIRGSTR